MGSRALAGSVVAVLSVAVCAGITLLGLGLSPVAAASNRVAEGAELYHERGCAHCHGAAGEGTDRGPSLHGVRQRLSKGGIEHQIEHGGKEMPAFGDTLSHGQIKSLVAFLRSGDSFATTEQSPPWK